MSKVDRQVDTRSHEGVLLLSPITDGVFTYFFCIHPISPEDNLCEHFTAD